MHRFHRRALFAAPALLAATSARAQGFPQRPIRIISPYSPGGGTDTTARVMGPAMGEFLGQPIVVENRPGAAASLGAAAVAEAPADGYTLLIDSLNHVVNPHLLRGLRFNYATAFTPVSVLTILPQLLVVPTSLPVTNVAEFVAWARARPGRLAFGSSGNASGSHLVSTIFQQETGLDLQHVPYRGGSAVLPDLISGTVSFAFATVNSATGLVREGRLKALAIASAQRVPALPDVPTTAEAGYPKVVLDEWNALYAPAGTPPEVLARIHAAVRHAMAQQMVRDRFAGIGAMLVGSPPEEAARYVSGLRDAMGQLVRSANITIE